MHAPDHSISMTPALQPGWPEMAAGLVTYLICLGGIGIWLLQIPDEQAGLRGIVGMAANGVAGCIAFMAAFSLRIRNFRAFGFRGTERKWLCMAAAVGLAAFALSFLIEGVYFHFITEPNTQGDFQAAAKGGVFSLIILLITGAILTPLGEEIVFRGVIANALNKYGFWAGVVLSAAIFAVVHGLSVILLLAFMVGIIAGVLFRKTGSLWPCIILHVVYNGLHLLYYATL